MTLKKTKDEMGLFQILQNSNGSIPITIFFFRKKKKKKKNLASMIISDLRKSEREREGAHS